MNNFYGYPFYIIFENIETVSKQLTMLINKNNRLLFRYFSNRANLERYYCSQPRLLVKFMFIFYY